MGNIRLDVSYDGTGYKGFQVQSAGIPTVQGSLEAALKAFTGEEIRIVGSGRTDAGVHASGQVINFMASNPIPTENYVDALNSRLPADICIRSAQEVSPNFHARYSAVGKTYRYIISTESLPDPVLDRFTWRVGRFLDLDAMKLAAGMIIGRHDFGSFRTAGSTAGSAVREVSQSEITMLPASLPPLSANLEAIVYEVTADGFLYNMVRNIVALLYRVGIGQLRPDEVKTVLLARNRAIVGEPAPPQGLWLLKVWY